MIQILRSQSELADRITTWRTDGHGIALVPTMGALHEGHLSLVRLALRHADRVIASIYVNPTQFAPDEDLAAYPRDAAGDFAKLRAAGAQAAYLPDTLYAPDHATHISVEGFSDLEGAERPDHFGGVALVVAKLFNRVRPDIAVFGEKDYQQLALVRRLVRDLDFPIRILGAPIVRDAHGLALSSRNRYFDAEQLEVARKLNRRLAAAKRAIEDGADAETAIAQAHDALLADGFARVDYLELRDADTLKPVTHRSREGRLLAVARLAGVRLLDNMAIALTPDLLP